MKTPDSVIEANSQLVTDYYAEASSGSLEGLYRFYTDDVVLKTPGRNFMSGNHIGHEGVREYLEGNTSQFTGGVLPVTEVHATVVDATHVVVIHTSTFELPGKSPFAADRVVVYRIRDQKFSSIVLYEQDQYGLDAALEP